MTFRDRLVADWYRARLTPLTAALLPLSLVYRAVAALRRAAYVHGFREGRRLPVPVVVVGNIAIGGTGKTPLALALAEALTARGFTPGIVSRGYGGGHAAQGAPPLVIGPDADPYDVGDEPLMFALCGWPIAIGRDRYLAGRSLLAERPDVDGILSDDGLQHYRLARDVEIAVIDGARASGNHQLIPAGPLREPVERLFTVDVIVVTEPPAGSRDKLAGVLPAIRLFAQRITPDTVFRRVNDPSITVPVARLAGDDVHALAGIGNPARFFTTLAELGIEATTHPLPDHHRYAPADLAIGGARAILMTAKDAVKCRAFADARCWFLPVVSRIDAALVDRVEALIRGSEAARNTRVPGDQGPARL